MKGDRAARDVSSIRFLLLQFLSLDDPLRQDRSEFFPFFLGQARTLGIDARWLHCGIYSHETSHLNAHIVRVDDEESRYLIAGIAPFEPTDILVPDLLDAPVEQALRSAFPGVSIVSIHGQDVAVQTQPGADWLPRLLGLPTADWEGRHLVDAVAPQYDCRLTPPPPRYEVPAPDLLPVVCGPSCLYARPIARNPYFEDLPLSYEVIDRHSCSFCCRAGGRRYPFETPPLELALRQCTAAAATRDKNFADVYRIRGAAVAVRIGAFLREITARELPPCRFCFEFRVDELLKVADQIEAALPALKAAGHALYVYNAGLENFSPTEQTRLNKGVTVEQVFAVVDHVDRWRRDFPDTFDFGNFGMIVFTPWTRLEDVAANLEGMQQLRDLGIPTGERHIGSKLQMFRDIALYDLAVHDGVEFLDIEWKEGQAVDPETGHFWFDGQIKGSADVVEYPWRFLHEDTAMFYEVVWRACLSREADERAQQDPLLVEIQSLLATRKDVWEDSLPFLRDALAVARSEPRPTTPAEIVARLVADLPPLPPPPTEEGALPAPRTPIEKLLVEKADRLRFALGHLETAPRSPLPGWRLVEFQPDYSQGARGFDVSLENGGERLVLRLRPGDDPEEAFATAPHLKLVHAPDTPPTAPGMARAIRRLCAILDHYLQTR